MNDKDREAFEKWHDNKFETSARTSREKHGYPDSPSIQQRFQSWQAALDYARKEQKELLEICERAFQYAKSLLSETYACEYEEIEKAITAINAIKEEGKV